MWGALPSDTQRVAELRLDTTDASNSPVDKPRPVAGFAVATGFVPSAVLLCLATALSPGALAGLGVVLWAALISGLL